jgi:hypothetical protein
VGFDGELAVFAVHELGRRSEGNGSQALLSPPVLAGLAVGAGFMYATAMLVKI